MRYDNLNGYAGINRFVAAKLKKFTGMEKNFRSLFEMMFEERDNVMLERTDGYRIEKTTYGACRETLLRRAATLQALLGPTERGATIGLSVSDGQSFIELLWAVLACGCNPLLINARLDDASIAGALERTGAAAVVSDGRRFAVRTIAERDVTEADAAIGDGPFGEEILVMSSGTSMNVKVCAYTAEEFYYQIKDSYQIIKKCRQVKKHYEGELKLLAFLPFYHIFGLTAVYLWFAFFSRTFVLLKDYGPQTVVNTIRKHKVTHIFAVPLFWERVYGQAIKTIRERGEKTYAKFEKALALVNKLPTGLGSALAKAAFREVRENLFGDSIRFMITGGSGIPGHVMEFFNGIGYRLADGYGMTEIGITSVELSSNRKILNACSIGSPVSSVEYAVNEEGELLVRGKAVARYVLDGGGKACYQREWFNTQDLVKKEKGRYYVLGRKDDLVVSPTGENLNPNLIEPKFDVRGTAGVCLIGDDRSGQCKPVLIVSVNRHLKRERLAEIGGAIRDRIAELNLTAQIAGVTLVSDPLMRDEEFKLNRKRIKGDYLAGRLSVVRPEDGEAYEGEDSELAKTVKEFFATALGKAPEDVGYASDFFLDEGGTSLDYFSMIAALQRQFGVTFPSAEERSLNSVKDVCEFIEETA